MIFPNCAPFRTGFLKYELKTLPNVAEVATLGGMVKQYQVVMDPQKLVAYRVTQQDVAQALRRANQETGGAVLEMGEREYMVRASGYLQSLEDFKSVPLRASATGVPVLLGQVATVQLGPEMRRGVAELDGEGEVVGGVVILRSGKNAREALQAVKNKLETLKASLPPGVELVTTYDRSQLIDRAINNLSYKLLEEFGVVALVCLLFLWHLRSSLVAINHVTDGHPGCLYCDAVSGHQREHLCPWVGLPLRSGQWLMRQWS
ncbi:Cation efflux system protein CusA (plasmid) [Pseudomonas cerasi]|uniref:Cation efflux system protein CusA n=1 Tax=Pseudomonas cerasi TaxID=1583341 RepID=A0A2K4W2E2_9PSED|nr:Cation efflux system protein CusA [Pseudomonas cerasi]